MMVAPPLYLLDKPIEGDLPPATEAWLLMPYNGVLAVSDDSRAGKEGLIESVILLSCFSLDARLYSVVVTVLVALRMIVRCADLFQLGRHTGRLPRWIRILGPRLLGQGQKWINDVSSRMK